MIKNLPNKTLFGFESMNDFLTTLFGNPNNKFIIGVFSIYGATTSFISNYIYDNAKAVYFLFFLLVVDLITAIYRSMKSKTFNSKRLGRVLIVMVSYAVTLSIAWNAGKYSLLFAPLAGLIYNGFVAVNLLSIYENLIAVNLIPTNVGVGLIKKISSLVKFDKDKKSESNEKEND